MLFHVRRFKQGPKNPRFWNPGVRHTLNPQPRNPIATLIATLTLITTLILVALMVTLNPENKT